MASVRKAHQWTAIRGYYSTWNTCCPSISSSKFSEYSAAEGRGEQESKKIFCKADAGRLRPHSCTSWWRQTTRRRVLSWLKGQTFRERTQLSYPHGEEQWINVSKLHLLSSIWAWRQAGFKWIGDSEHNGLFCDIHKGDLATLIFRLLRHLHPFHRRGRER